MKARFKIQEKENGWVVFDALLKRVPGPYQTPMEKGKAEGLVSDKNEDKWNRDIKKSK